MLPAQEHFMTRNLNVKKQKIVKRYGRQVLFTVQCGTQFTVIWIIEFSAIYFVGAS